MLNTVHNSKGILIIVGLLLLPNNFQKIITYLYFHLGRFFNGLIEKGFEKNKAGGKDIALLRICLHDGEDAQLTYNFQVLIEAKMGSTMPSTTISISCSKKILNVMQLVHK